MVNDVVAISANSGWDRQQFVRWEIGPSVTIANDMSLTSTSLEFLMPAEDVIATAIYEYTRVLRYAIVVLNDGNGTAGASETWAPMGSVITLTAEANEGYRFKEWRVYKGHITLSDNKDNPAQFRMRNYGVEVMAIFEPESKVGNEIPQTKAMKAYVQNGTLHVSGLAEGSTVHVYPVSGSLLCNGVPRYSHEGTSSPFGGVEASVLLPGRGVYIVTDGKEVLKVMN
jgi:hypothetical protein